jgi:hypothetical protein
MPLRWRSKPRFDVPRPASGRLPAKNGRRKYMKQCPLQAENGPLEARERRGAYLRA